MTRSTRRLEREALAWALEAMTPADRLWTIASTYVLPRGFWWLEEEPGRLIVAWTTLERVWSGEWPACRLGSPGRARRETVIRGPR